MKTMADAAKAIVNHPSFQEAWDLTADAGIGSAVATKKLHRLIKTSDWHLKNITDIAHIILKSAVDWADKDVTEENMRDFDLEIIGQLLTVASVYTLMGLLVGITLAGIIDDPHPETGESNDANCMPTAG